MDSSRQDSPEFYYGRRHIVTYNQTGQPRYQFVALTADDFLDPKEGDAFNHGDRHDTDVRRAVGIFRRLYRNNPTKTVFTRLKMQWAITGLPRPEPDVAIVPDVVHPHRPRQLFDVAIEGTSPVFILEVVSPRFADQDLSSKLHAYAQAGVSEYFIVDSGERDNSSSTEYQILGYSLRDGIYQRIEQDDTGRVLSKATGVWFSVGCAGVAFQVINTHTGEPIEPMPEDIESAAQLRSQGEARARSIAESLSFTS